MERLLSIYKMPFEFSLLSLKRNNCDCDKDNHSKTEYKKIRGVSNSKKSIKQRDKFTKAVKKCHRVTESKEKFGDCMKKELKK